MRLIPLCAYKRTGKRKSVCDRWGQIACQEDQALGNAPWKICKLWKKNLLFYPLVTVPKSSRGFLCTSLWWICDIYHMLQWFNGPGISWCKQASASLFCIFVWRALVCFLLGLFYFGHPTLIWTSFTREIVGYAVTPRHKLYCTSFPAVDTCFGWGPHTCPHCWIQWACWKNKETIP